MAALTISVVIPTHNRHEVLRQVLTHIKEGSHTPNEVIIVDDGSTPPVSEGLDLDEIGIEGLQIIRHAQGRGAAAARNAGARAATSDVIHFVDDDVFPDYHCLRFHHQIHTENPEPEYAVMGRLYFDPDLPRTPIMHYLEEEGGFTAVAKGEDREIQSTGLISANFSIKRAFLESSDEIFDENFPYSQNEDTEFGVRLVEQGLMLHYRIGPSARHHSTFVLENFFRKVWEGGVSKAYWAQKNPNETKFQNYLMRIVLRKSHETEYNHIQAEYTRVFGEKALESDIQQWDSAAMIRFNAWMGKAVAWTSDIGIYDGWERYVPRFAEIADHVSRASMTRDVDTRIELLESARKLNKNFLPIALLLADELVAIREYKEACEVLKKIGHTHSSLVRLFIEYNHAGLNNESIVVAKRVYEEARRPLAIHVEYRTKAATHLMRLCKHQQLSAEWISKTLENLTPDEYRHQEKWINWLLEKLEAYKTPGNDYETLADLRGRNFELDDLEKRADLISNNLHAVERSTGIRTRIRQISDKLKGASKRKERSDSSSPQPAGHETESAISPKITGTISWYTPEKRFGFIQPDHGTNIAFLHSSNLASIPVSALTPGLKVSYIACETPLGLEAREIVET